MVALAEYQRATGDARYLPLATKFAAFILYMQRPDGSFRHLYDPRTKQYDDSAELLYYSGEATLALARMYVVTKDERYAKAAERGLDWLVDWYDFFIGGFFYGEEHWTCIAAEALWPYGTRDKAKDFCHGYGAFLRAQQPAAGEHPDQDDLVGAYNLTSFVTPVQHAGRLAHRGDDLGLPPRPAPRHPGRRGSASQIRAALQYALGQQIRPENDFAVVGPGRWRDAGQPDRPQRADRLRPARLLGDDPGLRVDRRVGANPRGSPATMWRGG